MTQKINLVKYMWVSDYISWLLILPYIIVHICQIHWLCGNLMVFPPILLSYGGHADITNFEKIYLFLISGTLVHFGMLRPKTIRFYGRVQSE